MKKPAVELLPHQRTPGYDNPNCIACGLCEGTANGALRPEPPQNPFMQASREKKVKNPIMVVGEAVGGVEDANGRSFAGRGAVILKKALEKSGLAPREMVFVNCVRCKIPKNKKPTNKQIDFCRPFLMKDIERIKPSWILVCGNPPLQSVLHKSGIMKQRRKVMHVELADGTKVPVVASLSPWVTQFDRNLTKEFYADIEVFADEVLGRSVVDKRPPINLYATAEDVRSFHEQTLAMKYPEMTCDLETNTLYPFLEKNTKVFCAGLSNGATTIVVPLDEFAEGPVRDLTGAAKKRYAAWKALMRDKAVRKINHNVKYDMNVTHVRFGFEWANVHLCTQALDFYLHPIKVGHDLETLAGNHLNLGDFKSETNDNWKNSKLFYDHGYEALATRSGMDAYATYKISKIQRAELKKRPKQEQDTFRHVVMGAYKALQRMEVNGIKADVKQLDFLEKSLSARMEELSRDLRGLPTAKAFRKHNLKFLDQEKYAIYRKWKKAGADLDARPKGLTLNFLKEVAACAFRPSAGESIATLLFGAPSYHKLMDDEVIIPPNFGCPFNEKGGLTDTGLFSTEEDVLLWILAEIPDNPELSQFITKLIEWKKAQKRLSTYVKGLNKCLDREKYIHPKYNVGRAETGRNSCSDPNLQNQPRLPDQRNVFIPADGFIMVESDLSQIELRVLAAYTKDEGLCGAYRDGIDLHTKTARWLFGIPDSQEPDKEQRAAAKIVNFSVVYLKVAQTLAVDLNTSVEEAQEFIDSLYEAYPGIPEWQNNTMAFAAKHGYVTTMFGNRRLLENARIKGADYSEKTQRERAFRQAVNTPVQGTATQILNCALINIDKEIRKRKLPVKLTLTVHDSIVADVHPSVEKEYLQLADWSMSNAALPWIGDQFCGVPILAEHKIGERWGDLKTVHVEAA